MAEHIFCVNKQNLKVTTNETLCIKVRGDDKVKFTRGDRTEDVRIEIKKDTNPDLFDEMTFNATATGREQIVKADAQGVYKFEVGKVNGLGSLMQGEITVQTPGEDP